jgi:lambda family phage tail tape measure protein
MAKTVGDLLIKLGVDGIEGVTALKGSLRTLSNVSTASDKQLERLRKEIIQVAKASNVSQQSIRGQIDAFKGLKQQATIGSSVYKRLGKDIDAITQSLDRLNRKEEETKKQRTAKQIFGTESVAVVPEKFNRQIAAGNELLQKLGVTSAQYATQLAAVTARTQEFSRAQQRQQVIAQNLVATNRAQTTGFLQSSKVNIENTHTTAALKQKIAELAQDLDNIDVGSKEYITTSNRLKDAQEELNVVLGISRKAFDELSRAQERAERRAAKLAGIQAAQAGAIGTRDPGTGAMIAGGSARASLVQQPVREISGLYRSIGDIGMSGISADIDRMGKSYQEVAQDIREATLASNGSINSLQAQRASWAQLRAGLSPTSKAYQDVGREIEKVDRRLEKLNKRRRRPTIGGAASALGGIAAGGVFGGPEGAVGGAIGGAFGGVAGVAAGAAIGAQVKMMREALGATSEYAAELQKLEIALEGVAGARYTDALKVAANVTRDFNVPLAVSTRGITRLSAAIIGAGGNVDDAEVVFRNITSAIKATGGGAQDVESAITAMVQTFSKGKVSAEELSGQLGERLPGAVTKFAEANNMTLPELQKAFKAGTVGLDQLMKFIISLGPEYEATARRIADSSADAGAKATVAFEQVRREIGEALQPIGAELQEAFAEFALEVLPAVKTAAVAAAAGMKVLMDATAALVANFKEILMIAGAAGIALVITNLSAIMLGLAAALGKATVAMKGFTAASLLNPWVALAAGITAATVAIIKHTQRHKEFNKAVMEGSVTNKEANDRLRELNQEIKELEELKEKTGNNQMLIALTSQINQTKKAAEELKLAMKLATPYTVSGISYDPATGAAINAPMSYTPTDFDDPTPEDGGTGGGRELMSEVELQLRRQMREAIEAENLVRQSLVQLELDLLAAAREVEDVNRRTNLQEQAQADHQQRMNDIAKDGLKIFENQEEMRERALDHVREATIAASGLSEAEMSRLRIAEELADFQEDYKDFFSDEKMLELLKALEDALNKLANKADDTGESFDSLFRDKLDDMINVAPKLANVAANAIGQISSGLVEMIATGETNFKKMAASILKEMAKILMQAAIAKTIKMFLSADGNVVQGGRIKPYAKGGVVAEPTMFPMAGGDVGLMGEAGPEAIMPLKRASNGKLGVEVAGRSNAIDAMNRYSMRNNAGGTSGFASSGDEAAAGSQPASQPIDVRYTVERINSVDYVTADQFQAGMRQAADQGAKQGEQKTLKRLQMSSGTRKRLGM